MMNLIGDLEMVLNQLVEKMKGRGKARASGTVFCPGWIAGLGWGPLSALAVKLLNPDKPVLSADRPSRMTWPR